MGHPLSLAALALAAGCGFSKMQSHAVDGTAPGALNGTATGSTVRGAIIGAAVGGVAGGVIGQQMDNQARELSFEMPGATVQRVAEGITVIFPEGSLFDTDSDSLLLAAREDMRRFAASLAKYANTRTMIVSHTDSRGTSNHNADLSERRALSTASFLAAEGVARTRIGTAGRGATEPVATNDTEAGRRLNRRVEVAIYSSQSTSGGN